MKITAQVRNTAATHEVTVATAGRTRSITLPARTEGRGSEVNGGEFLVLALATCYCNDIYREAKRLGLEVSEVEVEASAEFMGVGLSASNIQYRARISSEASEEQIAQLLEETDAVAEVHNTLRAGSTVTRADWQREQ